MYNYKFTDRTGSEIHFTSKRDNITWTYSLQAENGDTVIGAGSYGPNSARKALKSKLHWYDMRELGASGYITEVEQA